jgi:hypothetical protein
MKWFWIAVLIVVGIVAAVFAGEYLTTGIGHLPSWVPGNHPGTRGHEYKRGYVAVLVAVGCFGGAGWLIYKNQQAAKSDGGSSSAS